MRKIWACAAVALVFAAGLALWSLFGLGTSSSTEERGGERTPSVSSDPVEEVSTPTSPVQTALTGASDSGRALLDRLLALRKLPRNLNREQLEQLRAIILDTSEKETLRNDALNILHKQNIPPAWVGRELVQMWGDEEESARWRDFCLQHMAFAYGHSPDKQEIQQALLEASHLPSEGGKNFGGTAMLSLQRMSEEDPALRRKLRAEATETLGASSSEMDEEKAVTALQVLKESDSAQALQDARAIAGDGSRLVRLRLSALSVLGEHGGAQDLDLLERLTEHEDNRIRRAAKIHLRRLRKSIMKTERKESGKVEDTLEQVSGILREGEEG